VSVPELNSVDTYLIPEGHGVEIGYVSPEFPEPDPLATTPQVNSKRSGCKPSSVRGVWPLL